MNKVTGVLHDYSSSNMSAQVKKKKVLYSRGHAETLISNFPSD